MAGPGKHDGSLFRKEESKFWWMDYRDRAGKARENQRTRRIGSEAQKRLWISLLRKAEVAYFRIYDLRSTYATRLSAGGEADECA